MRKWLLGTVFVLGVVTAWNMAYRVDDVTLSSSSGVSRLYKVRTHLITGRSEKLTAYGWVPLD